GEELGVDRAALLGPRLVGEQETTGWIHAASGSCFCCLKWSLRLVALRRSSTWILRALAEMRKSSMASRMSESMNWALVPSISTEVLGGIAAKARISAGLLRNETS